MKKITADWLFPVSSPPIAQGVLVVEETTGKILAIEPRSQHDLASLQIHRGIITPGFVNAHCHLELSHLKGKIATGTGLIPFISGVVSQRSATPEQIQEAIEQAEAEMLAGGIVAVGDISNATDTFLQKSKGNLRYYTFVEMFDFLQDERAVAAFEQYKTVLDVAPDIAKNKKSAVPHAPYSVSKLLFEKINQQNARQLGGCTVSIHNQETSAENELFYHKKGQFLNFYKNFGISLDTFEPTQKSSIHYALANLNPANRHLFVHNTLTTEADIQAAHAWSDQVFWATCANANLYIENKLPDYQLFINQNARMTIGTDSLSSNWQLSVLEEMKTIARYQSNLSAETLVRWATLHGAQALGFDDELGSLEVDKIPGINLIENMSQDHIFNTKTSVQRLF